MNDIIRQMLKKYTCHSVEAYESALKEIIQEVALLGLSRAKFFEHAAFYGGTSLRILYGIDRFSEDLDFSLLKPDPHFTINSYTNAIVEELQSMGLQVNVTEKEKTVNSTIQSAFIKAGTLNHLLQINVPDELTVALHHKKQMKIKLEVDTDPPPNFNTEAKHLLQPIPFSVLSYQLPDLFAGKVHAMLCRQWQTRVKGRDWYDFVWFIGHQVPLSAAHLKARLVQGGMWHAQKPLRKEDIRFMMVEKIKSIDVEQAKLDVLPFLRREDTINIWSRDFFLAILDKLTVKENA